MADHKPQAQLNPQAERYLQAQKIRALEAQKPAPPIPALNAPAIENVSMADNAIQQRLQQQAVQPSLFGGARPVVPGQPNLTMADMLTVEATTDPLFQRGQGEMLAVNQPLMAMKYGVIRNGKKITPMELQTGKPGLSPTTLEGLAAAQKASEQAAKQFEEVRKTAEMGVPAGEAAAEKAGAAGEAGKTADAAAKDAAAREKVLREMDEFDYDGFRDVVMKDLLNNDEQRKIVEARLEPLDLSELIMKGFVRQRVPIVPGVFEPTFQSYTGDEDLALKRMLMKERKTLDAPDRYYLDRYRMMTIAMAVHAITNTILPSHYDQSGKFSEEAFTQKLEVVINLNFHLLSSLATHFYYFDVRVRKLFVAEKLKNG